MGRLEETIRREVDEPSVKTETKGSVCSLNIDYQWEGKYCNNPTRKGSLASPHIDTQLHAKHVNFTQWFTTRNGLTI